VAASGVKVNLTAHSGKHGSSNQPIVKDERYTAFYQLFPDG